LLSLCTPVRHSCSVPPSYLLYIRNEHQGVSARSGRNLRCGARVSVLGAASSHVVRSRRVRALTVAVTGTPPGRNSALRTSRFGSSKESWLTKVRANVRRRTRSIGKIVRVISNYARIVLMFVHEFCPLLGALLPDSVSGLMMTTSLPVCASFLTTMGCRQARPPYHEPAPPWSESKFFFDGTEGVTSQDPG
jgi:hypothetical protein